jgi:hypothetical protein
METGRQGPVNAYVAQVKSHNAYRDSWEITVERGWSSSRPRSSDLPTDVRAALTEWLASADSPREGGDRCCDLHNVHCEPPGDLCCYRCTEVEHPKHPPGVRCVLEQESDRG